MALYILILLVSMLWNREIQNEGVPSVVSTEVSQVPLSGVRVLLEAGNAAGSVTVLDVDVSPDVCVHEARLGSIEELIHVVRLAQVSHSFSEKPCFT
jgi:hypothetical protein